MLELALNTFVVLFVVIDPIGMAPVFVGLTRGEPAARRRRAALHGTALAAVILLVFFFVGDGLLQALGIGVPAFRIAGGLFLFLLAVDMVFARQSGLRSTTPGELREAEHREDITVFPLAFPLVAGPGALTTVLLMASQETGWAATGIVLGVMGLVLVLLLVSLLSAERMMTLLGETGANVISRLLGLVLAALAVQYVVDGVRAAFPGG